MTSGLCAAGFCDVLALLTWPIAVPFVMICAFGAAFVIVGFLRSVAGVVCGFVTVGCGFCMGCVYESLAIESS